MSRVWREFTHHRQGGCYFCTVVLKSGKQKTVYPSWPCSIAPVYTDNDSELPSPPSKEIRIQDEIESSDSCVHFSDDYVYKPDDPVKLKSSDFNKIMKELKLGKRSSKSLLKLLKQNYLTEKCVTSH